MSTRNKNTPNKKRPQANSQQKLRIIAGQWRGRQLSFPDVDGLRPTGDRIRETLFNWLMYELQGRNCLDAFAGSGALGFEALSRGAKTTHFLEIQTEAARHLQRNIETLGATGAEIITQSACTWLTQNNATRFDVVFIDPPFAANLWQEVIDKLEDNEWLNPDSWIYIESPKESAFTIPLHWKLHREKSAGNVRFQLFRRELDPDNNI